MWEPGGTQSASPGGVQFGSRSNFAPTEPCVPCNLAFVSSGHPLFLRNCVNDHLWYPLLGYFFRGNDHLWECISRNWNWPVAMVVQVALLAERLGAKRAQDLQSKVLGSIVAVKIPPGWESYSTELMETLPKYKYYTRTVNAVLRSKFQKHSPSYMNFNWKSLQLLIYILNLDYTHYENIMTSALSHNCITWFYASIDDLIKWFKEADSRADPKINIW